MKSFKIRVILFFVFASLIGFAQNEISGKIKDLKDSSGLVGVTVYIPDLKLGAITDNEGKYTIRNIPKGTFLIVVSFIGYASQTKEADVKESSTLDFVLEESGNSLKEIIVTGVSSATESRSLIRRK